MWVSYMGLEAFGSRRCGGDAAGGSDASAARQGVARKTAGHTPQACEQARENKRGTGVGSEGSAGFPSGGVKRPQGGSRSLKSGQAVAQAGRPTEQVPKGACGVTS